MVLEFEAVLSGLGNHRIAACCDLKVRNNGNYLEALTVYEEFATNFDYFASSIDVFTLCELSKSPFLAQSHPIVFLTFFLPSFLPKYIFPGLLF